MCNACHSLSYSVVRRKTATSMKKKDDNRWLLLLILFVGPLSSCVYDKEFAYFNDQIAALNRRVTRVEGKMDAKLGSDLESFQSNQAEFRVEIDQLKRELGEMTGRVEDNERVIRHTFEKDLGNQDTMQAELNSVSLKVAALLATVKHQNEYLGLEPLPALEEQKKKEEEIEQKEQKETGADDELALYDNSLALFHDRKYEDAMVGFREFLKRYPKSDRADNAQFWVGECYMALKQYEQAILSYQEVIKKFPKGNKVPNALLRQAVAFQEIKDKTSSKLLLNKIIKNYPKSHEAEIARKRLTTLK